MQSHAVHCLSLYVDAYYQASSFECGIQNLTHTHTDHSSRADEFCCMGQYTGNHFSRGRCEGMQYRSSRWKMYGAYAGIGVGVTAGVVVVTPIVIGAFTSARCAAAAALTMSLVTFLRHRHHSAGCWSAYLRRVQACPLIWCSTPLTASTCCSEGNGVLLF
jgi:hypothetical protein